MHIRGWAHTATNRATTGRHPLASSAGLRLGAFEEHKTLTEPDLGHDRIIFDSRKGVHARSLLVSPWLWLDASAAFERLVLPHQNGQADREQRTICRSSPVDGVRL